MDADTLGRVLQRRGLVILGVTGNRMLPEVLVVVLHGNAGQWIERAALRKVRAVPGVLACRSRSRRQRFCSLGPRQRHRSSR